eukprot:TRINITY_DN8905_c0_g1_i1.p1 TRINITY_DN8905_c0_g1~~TRINITY_DN8905_c0_g1_i1.p1  ORF type:complete len:392 (+),score=66.57 TRINITY_DN8905_c0_g1_i1:51-1226(+)
MTTSCFARHVWIITSYPVTMAETKLGDIVIEGKTKIVYNLSDEPGHVLLRSKDRITAGDGARSHEIEGKSAVSNETTCAIFEFLNMCNIDTHYVRKHDSTSFVALKVDMIPIECVCRRLAYGSYLRRFKEPFPVKEAYRFDQGCVEFFYKDDANHDPQVTKEQLISSPLTVGGTAIQRHHVELMEQATRAIFEILERAWQAQNCSLVDMKIEFGLTSEGKLVLGDVVDNDAWRLWPQGDKRLMQDKQFYRELKSVSAEDLTAVLKKYEWVAQAVKAFQEPVPSQVLYWPESAVSKPEASFANATYCKALGARSDVYLQQALAQHENTPTPTVYVVGDIARAQKLATMTLRPVVAAEYSAQAIVALVDHVTWGKRRGQAYQRYASDCQTDHV